MSKQTTENTAFHAMDAAEALRILKSDRESGLRTADAEARLQKYGPNALKKGRKKTLLQRFILQFGDFMVLILLGAAAVSFATSCLQGEADFADTLLILGIVMANALIGTVQEAKAEHALEALRTMSAPHASVLRDGKRAVLTSEALVPGDIVLLKTGDVVPADLRLLESTQLYAEESALTGESVPAAKSAGAVCAEKTGAAERENMLFSGTGVASGHGVGVVTATGMETEMGRIAAMLGEEETPDTPLKARLRKTGKVIGLLVVLICAVIFVIGLIQRVNPLEMFMIAPCGRRDPGGASGRRHDRPRARRAPHGGEAGDHPAPAGGGDARKLPGDLLRQDRHADAEPDDRRALCGRRGTARNGSGGQHARCGGAVHDGRA